MPQMAEAQKRPERDTDQDRLRKVALKAMVEHPSSPERAENAIWEAVRKDRTLMDALLAKYRRRAISDLLDRSREYLGWRPAMGVRPEIMHIPTAAHEKAMNSPLERRAQMVSTEWDRGEKAELQRQKDAEIARLDKIRDQRMRDQWLYTAAAEMRVNARPFWQVSVNEARSWITSTKHEARFLELVVAGLPNDGRPIEYYRQPDEMNAVWERAKQPS